MTQRPSADRLAEIRRIIEENAVPDAWGRTLFAEIDALTAERDKYHDDFMAAARRECAFEKERDQWRAYAEKLREALEFYAKGSQRINTKGYRREFGCGCCVGTVEDDEGSLDFDTSVQGLTAREALSLSKPGEEK